MNLHNKEEENGKDFKDGNLEDSMPKRKKKRAKKRKAKKTKPKKYPNLSKYMLGK